MAHHIFLIHGMGDFKDKWSQNGDPSVQAQLKGFFKGYKDTAPVADEFQIHEVNYNTVFEKWREIWKKNSSSAAAAATALGISKGIASDLIKLAGAPVGDGLLRTHVLDVALYRFCRQISDEVMLTVIDTVGKVYAGGSKTDPSFRYSLIAHSLGTVVAYEAFHANLSSKKPLPPASRPDNVFMIANTAAALWQRGPDIYRPEVAPNLASDRGWCFKMANFGHRLDPVARLRPFDPPTAWFDPGMKDSTYLDVWLKETDVQELNVHSLSHYLGHPSVHIPILRHLVSSNAISKPVEEQAIEDWRKKRDDIFKHQAQQTLGALLLKLSPNLIDQLALVQAFRALALDSQSKSPDGDA
ncbi:hypothetical protein ACNI65_06325 [Roseateles sp. So40a]|uniref:hypothetical protein n=1 Tax=Roseateles sp. So40a TaxID=3400226 RepID=UPI003A8370FF